MHFLWLPYSHLHTDRFLHKNPRAQWNGSRSGMGQANVQYVPSQQGCCPAQRLSGLQCASQWSTCQGYAYSAHNKHMLFLCKHRLPLLSFSSLQIVLRDRCVLCKELPELFTRDSFPLKQHLNRLVNCLTVVPEAQPPHVSHLI